MAIGRPARAFYREILGVKVRVNLLAGTLKEANEKRKEKSKKD